MADDADLVADLELAGHGEAADAARLVLHVDAVEERGVLVIAGGVGGHDALDDEAIAGIILDGGRADVGDRSDGVLVLLVDDVELDIGGVGVLLAVIDDHGRHGDGGELRLVKGMGEVHGCRAVGGDRVTGIVGADHFAVVDRVDQGLDRGGLVLVVEEGGHQRGFLALVDRLGLGLDVGDAELQRLADPDRRGDGQVAVLLRHADEVVAVLGIQLCRQLTGGDLGGAVPGVCGHTAVDDDFDLADRIAGVGIEEGDHDVQLLGRVLIGEDRAHRHVVDRVEDLEVLVLGRVDAHRADRVVDALLGEVVGQDNVAGVVGVAPAALVVVLVVGGRQVPALVQRHDVLLVARVVAVLADRALAVADLDQEHVGVGRLVPVGEVGEVAEGAARVVELVQAVALVDRLVVELHARVAGLVVQIGVVAGNQTVAVEGVDVAGSAGPGHLKARNGDEVGMRCVEGCDLALVLLPERLAGRGHLAPVVERVGRVGGAGGVEVVGVVGEGDELDVRALREGGHVLQRGVQRAGAVGVGGVGVQLAEVKLIFRVAHGEAPALVRLDAVGALHRDRHGHAAVGQVLGRRPAQHAVGVHGLDRLVVDRHREDGIIAHVADLRGDDGPLVFAGLGVRRGRQALEEGLVDVLDDLLAGVLDPVAVLHRNGDREARGHILAVEILEGQDEAAALLVLGGLIVGHGAALAAGSVSDRQLRDLVGQVVQREAAGVILLEVAGILAVEDDGGILHDALVDLGALGDLVEAELEDRGGVRLEGPAGEDAGEELDADGRALVVGFLIIDSIAFAVRGQVPLGGVGQLAVLALLDEEELLVVVGGQVLAVDLEAVVAAHRVDGEDIGTVACLGLAFLDRGGHRVQGVGGFLGHAQGGLGRGTVDHVLAVLLQDAVPFAVVKGFDRVIGIDQIELQGVVRALKLAFKRRKAGEDLPAVADISLDVDRELDLDALAVLLHDRQRGALDVPGVIRRLEGRELPIVHRVAVVVRIDGQLGIGAAGPHGDGVVLIVIGIEAVAAVGVDLHRPYHVAGEVLDLVVFHGAAVGLHVPVAVGLAADGGLVGLAVDRDGHAVGQLAQIGDQVALARVDRNGHGDLAGQGVAQLQSRVVHADRRRDVELVADLDVPFAVGLADHGLVDLDRLAVGVLDGDVRVAVGAAVVIDLGHFEVRQLDVAADVGHEELADRLVRRLERQAAGFLIGRTAQLRQAAVDRARAGADHGVAQADVRRRRAEEQADAAGQILDEDVLAVDHGHDALDGELFAALAGQSLGDRAQTLDPDGIGEGHDLAALAVQHGLDLDRHVLGDGEGIALGPGLAAVGAGPDHRALGLAGEGHDGVFVHRAALDVRRRGGHGRLLFLHGDLAGQGVAQLQGRVVDADRQRHVDLVADLDVPVALGLADDGLVDLDGLAVGVLDADVRVVIAAVVVKDLGHFKVRQLDVAADVVRRQSADRLLRRRQRQAAGFLIRRAAQLGQAAVGRARAGADYGVAQGDVRRRGAEVEVNAAGRVLDIDVLAVDQGHDALDGELRAGRAGQGLGDRAERRLLGLDRVAEAHDLAVHAVQRRLDLDGHVLGDGVGIALDPGLAVGAVGNDGALGLAGEGHERVLLDFAARNVSRRGGHGHGLLALHRDLAGQGIAKLQGRVVDADRRCHVDHVSDLDVPCAVGLADDGLVDLDRRRLAAVRKRDVRVGVGAVVVIDLGHFEARQLDVGADIVGRQSADRRLLRRKRQAAGFLISRAAQLGQAAVDRARAGADQRVAQGDVRRGGAEVQVDAAGLVLDVDVLAVDQGNDALDGEFRAGLTGQRLGDRAELRLGLGRLDGVGKARRVALDAAQRGLDLHGRVLGDREGAALGPGRAVGAGEDHRARRRTGEGDDRVGLDLAGRDVSRRRQRLLGVERELVGFGVPYAPGGEAVVILQRLLVVVDDRLRVDDVPAVAGLLQRPAAVVAGRGEAQAVAGLRRSQDLPVQREGIRVAARAERQHGHILGQAQLAVVQPAGRTGQLAAADGVVERHAALGMVDHQPRAGCRDLGHPLQIGQRLRLLGGLGHLAALGELPEAQRLAGDVAVDARIAAPVGIRHVHAQIARGIFRVHRRQIAARQRKERAVGVLRRADAYAVVGGGDVELSAGRIGELVRSVDLGDCPAVSAVGRRDREQVVAHGRDRGRRRGAGVRRRQGPGGAVLRHGDRHGITARDISERHRLPDAGRSRRKGRRGQQ